MQINIDENKAKIQILNSNVSDKLQNLKADADTTQELVYRNSKLDVKLNTLENGRQEAAASEGAT